MSGLKRLKDAIEHCDDLAVVDARELDFRRPKETGPHAADRSDFRGQCPGLTADNQG